MTYYINPIWFYLMNISTELKTVLFILGVVTFASSVFAFIFWAADVDMTDLDDDEKKFFKISKKIIIASLILLLISIFVPSKEACVEMMIASQVTHENVTIAKEEIYELIDYVTDKVEDEK